MWKTCPNKVQLTRGWAGPQTPAGPLPPTQALSQAHEEKWRNLVLLSTGANCPITPYFLQVEKNVCTTMTVSLFGDTITNGKNKDNSELWVKAEEEREREERRKEGRREGEWEGKKEGWKEGRMAGRDGGRKEEWIEGWRTVEREKGEEGGSSHTHRHFHQDTVETSICPGGRPAGLDTDSCPKPGPCHSAFTDLYRVRGYRRKDAGLLLFHRK